MKSMISCLSTELYVELHQALLICEEFDSNMRLQGELAIYNSRIFERTYENKEDLVRNTISYLVRQRIQGKSALAQFLMVLHNTLIEGDELCPMLNKLHTQVIIELSGKTTVHHTQSLQTTKTSAWTTTNGTTTSSDIIDLPKGTFLSFAERNWLILLVNTVIADRGIDGTKNLLRDCFSDEIINRIFFHQGSYNTAETMVERAEARDKLLANTRYLEVFLTAVVSELGIEVQTKLEEILTLYNHRRRAFESKEPYHRQHTPIQPEEQAIAKAYQNARNTQNISSPKPTYKLDLSMITTCNLDKQRQKFIDGFNSRLKGFFTFAVASTQNEVLSLPRSFSLMHVRTKIYRAS